MKQRSKVLCMLSGVLHCWRKVGRGPERLLLGVDEAAHVIPQPLVWGNADWSDFRVYGSEEAPQVVPPPLWWTVDSGTGYLLTFLKAAMVLLNR